jgi:hypothetical protein
MEQNIMAAFAKLSLVTPVFHPSDVAFAVAWSEAAPGIGGWRVVLDKPVGAERVSVIPPASDTAVFCITRNGVDVVLERTFPDGERKEVGRFKQLREALVALCPLDGDAVEDIHESLERDYPRDRDR